MAKHFDLNDDAIIDKMLQDKAPIRAIAQVLGRTRISVEGRILRLDKGRKRLTPEQKWTEVDIAYLKQAVQDRIPHKEIAIKLQRKVSAIGRALQCYVYRFDSSNKRLVERVSFEQVCQSFTAKGCILLATEYTYDHVALPFICNEGHRTSLCWLSWKKTFACPVCRVEKMKLSIDEVRSHFIKENYQLLDTEYVNAQKPMLYRCPNGHQHTAAWSNWSRGIRCPQCSHSTSGPENELCSIYSSLGPIKTRQIIAPYELDIYFEQQKIGIEYCGLFWHSSYHEYHTPTRHYNKMKMCNDKGIRLITIFEDEWLNHKQLCLSRINAALGIDQIRLFARKCSLQSIDSELAKVFLDTHHLQGSSKREVAFGLFHDGQLVSVMSAGKPSRAHIYKDKKVLELKRFASLPNHIIVGGASRLFKKVIEYAKINHYEQIHSYCDMRWGTGNVYQKLSFILKNTSKYTPHYTDFVQRWRNQSFAAKDGKTEKQLAEEAGVFKIYDCGHQTWIYTV